MGTSVLIDKGVVSDVKERHELRRRPRFVQSTLIVASLFVSQIVTGLYDGLGRQVPAGWPVLNSLCISMSVIVWFWTYSRYYRIAWVLDMGWFLLAGWLIIVPYYVLQREGKRGLIRIGLFCLTYIAAWLAGLAVRIWVSAVTSAR